MKKQTGPDSVHLKTDEDLQTFIDHYDASIIGATPTFSSHDLRQPPPLLSAETQHALSHDFR